MAINDAFVSPIKKTGKTIMTTKKIYFQPVEVKKMKFEKEKTKHPPFKVLKDIIGMEDKENSEGHYCCERRRRKLLLVA